MGGKVSGWWLQYLNSGDAPGYVQLVFDQDESQVCLWEQTRSKESIYQSYKEADTHKHRLADAAFWTELKKLIPPIPQERQIKIGTGARKRVIQLPSLESCKGKFRQVVHDVDWKFDSDSSS
jgi:hypothetical protein